MTLVGKLTSTRHICA